MGRGVSGTKSRKSFRYGSSEDFLSRGQNTVGGGGDSTPGPYRVKLMYAWLTCLSAITLTKFNLGRIVILLRRCTVHDPAINMDTDTARTDAE